MMQVEEESEKESIIFKGDIKCVIIIITLFTVETKICKFKISTF